DQPSLDEEPEMAGNARLRLAQDGGEIGDGEFRLPQQRQDAQPSGLGRGLERPVERLERQVGRRRHRCGPGSHFVRCRRCQAGIKTYLYTLKQQLQGQVDNRCHPPSLPDSSRPAILMGNAPLRSTGEDHPMNDNAFGIRDGEIAVELPAKFDASLYFIGRIHTPWRRREDCPKNALESDAVCTLEVDERWAQALTGVETCSHLLVLYWMSRSRRDLVLQVPRHYGVGRGTFALRSPARPNPIAISVVRLLRVEGTSLSGVGLDCLDGT